MAKKISAATYGLIEAFLIAGGIYLAINFLINRGILLPGHWLNMYLRERQPEKRQNEIAMMKLSHGLKRRIYACIQPM